MTEELKQLREALRRVKYEAVSLANAQVIALEALTAAQPAQAGEVDAKCQTCNGHGLVGGHMQDGSGHGEGCPDCNPEPAPLVKWASTQPAAQAVPEPVTLIREMATRIKAANPGDAFFTLQILDELVKKLSAHARATPPQQAAGEPVGEVRIAHYGGRSRSIGFSTIALFVDIETLPVGTKLYTHPAPGVPEIDYSALIHAAWGKHKYAQGTGGCIAFKRGAEWFRDIALAAAQAKGVDPEDLAAAGVMLMGRREHE